MKNIANTFYTGIHPIRNREKQIDIQTKHKQ